MEAITADQIEVYRRHLLSQGKVSRRTVQKLMVLLHGALKRAVALRWTPRNPADEVE
ncbi:MAG TPA: phage integrase SAM-like domain-containing protein [Solirubrobacterales bacterium]|nr:phage integrase SAM-like domain-containing protein [Solirubrobacterales bacterium]